MLRFVLAVVTLATAIAVAAAGTLVVLPPLGSVDWMPQTAVTEFSLNLLLPILLALILAWFSGWSGMGRVGLVAAILAGLTIPLALVPAIRGGMEARDRGIPIDPWTYLAGSGLDVPVRSDDIRSYGPDHGAEPHGRDGERELVIWRPSESDPGEPRRSPAVLNVHDGDGFDRWNSWFTEQGMFAFELETDRPAEVKCALSWLSTNAAEFGVDPDRILLFGTGVGGHAAMLAAYADESAVPSACPTRTPRAAAVLALYPPSAPADPDAAPFRHLDEDDPPTLLAHGGRDPVVPVDESRRTAAELDLAGVPHRLVEIDYAGHGFDLAWGGFANQITRAEIENFLRDTVDRPHATPDGPHHPADPG